MSSITLLFSALLIVLPTFLIVTLVSNFDDLNEKRFKRSYGKFYWDLRLTVGSVVLI